MIRQKTCNSMRDAEQRMKELMALVDQRVENGGGFIPFSKEEREIIAGLAEWAEGTRFYSAFMNDTRKSADFVKALQAMTAEDLFMFALMKFNKLQAEGVGIAGVALIIPELNKRLEEER